MMGSITKYFPDGVIELNSEESGMTYGILKRWIQSRYLQKTDVALLPRYRISFSGKCKIVCTKLDVSFLELCIMTEAYITHKSQAKNDCKSSYVVCGLADLLGGIYSDSTIHRRVGNLCKRRFAERIQKLTIRLVPDTMKKLGEFDDILVRLHAWIIGISSMLARLSFYDQGLVDEIKN